MAKSARALHPEGRVQVRRISEYYMAQRQCLFVYVLRALPEDPMPQVTLFDGTGEPEFARKTRLGLAPAALDGRVL